MGWVTKQAIKEKAALIKALGLITYDGEFKDPDGNQVTPTGTQGASAGLRFVTDTVSVADSDPGSTKIRFNNANHTLATRIYISDQCVGAVDVSALIDTWTQSVNSKLFIRANDNLNTSFLVYSVTAVTDAVGYKKLTVAYVSGATFAGALPCVLQHYTVGADGVNGTNGTNGTNGSNGAAGAAGADGVDGADGSDGAAGANGYRAGTIMAMNTSVANSDPTPGMIKFNVAAIDATLNTMRIDDVDNVAANIEGLIAAYKAGDILDIKSASILGTTSLVVRVTGKPTDKTGWWDVPIAYLSGAMPTVNTELLAVQLLSQGARAGMPYLYGTATSGNPGAGFFRTNDNTIANSTIFLINEVDFAGITRSGDIASWAPTGTIIIESSSNYGVRYARFLITTVTGVVDSTTWYTISVEFQSGTNFVVSDQCAITYLPGANMSWTGTDILNNAGESITLPLTYDLLTDAYTATAAALSGKAAIVKKLCDNLGAQPCSIYSDGTKFSILGGKAVLSKGTPNQRISFPAAVWIGTYTFAAGAVDATGTTRVRSAAGALHGLLQANAVTGTPSFIKIMSTSGAGWTPGLYELTIVEDGGDDLTFKHPWSGTPAGQPVFGLAGADFDVYRIRIPRLSSEGSITGRSVHKYLTPGTTAGPRNMSIELVALGGAVGSGMKIYEADDTNTTNNSSINGVWGFFNNGDSSHQYRMFPFADPDGWGANSNSDSAATPGTVATGSAESELLFRVKGLQNETVNVKNYEIMVTI